MCFLFTDGVGSTRLWDEAGDGMAVALALHDRILREAIGAQAGYVFSTAGDGFAAAFPTPEQAAPEAAARLAEFPEAPAGQSRGRSLDCEGLLAYVREHLDLQAGEASS